MGTCDWVPLAAFLLLSLTRVITIVTPTLEGVSLLNPKGAAWDWKEEKSRVLDLSSLSHKLHWTVKLKVLREMILPWPVVSWLRVSELPRTFPPKPGLMFYLLERNSKSKEMKNTSQLLFVCVCCEFCGTMLVEAKKWSSLQVWSFISARQLFSGLKQVIFFSVSIGVKLITI